MLQGRAAVLLAVLSATGGFAYLASALLPWLSQGTAWLGLLSNGDSAVGFSTTNGLSAFLAPRWPALQASAGLLFVAFALSACTTAAAALVAAARAPAERLALFAMAAFTMGFVGTIVAVVEFFGIWTSLAASESGPGAPAPLGSAASAFTTGLASAIAGNVASFLALLLSKVLLHMPVHPETPRPPLMLTPPHPSAPRLSGSGVGAALARPMTDEWVSNPVATFAAKSQWKGAAVKVRLPSPAKTAVAGSGIAVSPNR